MKPIIALASLLSLTLVGCAEPSPDLDGAASVEVARIDSAHGQLRLLADPDGSIAIAETTRLRRSPAEALLADQQATPLELYLALAGDDVDADPALWADHLAARGGVAPRSLELPLAGVGVEPGFTECTSAEWPGFLAGVQATYDYKYRRWISTGDDIWTNSDSNDMYRRRFDACAGDDVPSYAWLNVLIQKKLNNQGGYTFVTDGDISAGERFWYSSQSGYPDWQMQVTRPGNGNTRSLGLGRAESPPQIAP